MDSDTAVPVFGVLGPFYLFITAIAAVGSIRILRNKIYPRWPRLEKEGCWIVMTHAACVILSPLWPVAAVLALVFIVLGILLYGLWFMASCTVKSLCMKEGRTCCGVECIKKRTTTTTDTTAKNEAVCSENDLERGLGGDGESSPVSTTSSTTIVAKQPSEVDRMELPVYDEAVNASEANR